MTQARIFWKKNKFVIFSPKSRFKKFVFHFFRTSETYFSDLILNFLKNFPRRMFWHACFFWTKKEFLIFWPKSIIQFLVFTFLDVWHLCLRCKFDHLEEFPFAHHLVVTKKNYLLRCKHAFFEKKILLPFFHQKRDFKRLLFKSDSYKLEELATTKYFTSYGARMHFLKN